MAEDTTDLEMQLLRAMFGAAEGRAPGDLAYAVHRISIAMAAVYARPGAAPALLRAMADDCLQHAAELEAQAQHGMVGHA